MDIRAMPEADIAARKPNAAGVILRSAVRLVDAYQRWRYHVFEYTDDPKCILRIRLDHAKEPVTLNDGTVIQPGDTILDLHLWNEHLPIIGPRASGLRWGVVANRRLAHSLESLAAYLDAHPELASVKGLRGLIRWIKPEEKAKLALFAELVGFELVSWPGPAKHRSWLRRLRSKLRNWAYVLVFNPRASHDWAERATVQVWISRKELMRRYGDRAAPAVQIPAEVAHAS